MDSRPAVTLGREKKCAYSGREIKRNEPRIVLYHLDVYHTEEGLKQETVDFHLKESEADEMRQEVREKEPVDETKNREYIHCPHLGQGDYVINTHDDRKDLLICEECKESLPSIIDSEKNTIEEDVSYWSTEGVSVRKPERNRPSQLDVGASSELVLVLGCGFPNESNYKLTEVEEVRNKIDKCERYKAIEDSNKCVVCDDEIEQYEQIIKLSQINSSLRVHDSCLEVLKNEIDKVVEHHSNYLMAKEI